MARRPKIEYNQESKPITLMTNMFKVDFSKEITELYLIRIDFLPKIEADNKVLRNKLISCCKNQLRDTLGSRFLINSTLIYSAEKPSFITETSIKINYQKCDYLLTLKITKSYSIDELNNEQSKRSQIPVMFLNSLGKNMLKNSKMMQFGNGNWLFDPWEEHQKVEGSNLIVQRGWNIGFENTREGVSLKLDSVYKLTRNENALNFINLLYKNNASLDKDEKRKVVRKRLHGQYVLSNYGNFREFKVVDVLFDKNLKELRLSETVLEPNTTDLLSEVSDPILQASTTQASSVPTSQQIQNIVTATTTTTTATVATTAATVNNNVNSSGFDGETTLFEYYLRRYGLKIRFERQPLFVVYERRQNRYVYCIPEFCLLTGMPDDINDFQRKELSSATKQKPQQMFDIISAFIKRLVNPDASGDTTLSGKNVQNQLGINIQDKPLMIKAKQIAYPTITFGGIKKESPRITLEENTATQFSLKYPIYSSNNFLQIALLHFKDFNTSELISNWCKTQKELRIDVKKPVEFNLGEFNMKAMQEIEHVIKREVKKEKFDIVAIVAPDKFSTVSNYNKIKRLCTIQQQIKSQYIRQSSLEQKSSYTISASIMTQMAAKCGATIWTATPPNGVPDKTIIIGTSVQKTIINGVAQFVVGYVASQDKHVSKFYSRAVFQKTPKHCIEKIRMLIVESIKQYFINNKNVPEHILYLREDIPHHLFQSFLNTEIKEVMQSFTDLSPQYKPNLCVILIDTKHGLKLFNQNSSSTMQPINPLQQLPSSSQVSQPVVPQLDTECQNPMSGTVVDSQVTSRHLYDFYMVSQNIKFGTAVPVHYTVVYDTTGFSEGRLQELLYSQCFNYVNFTGAIKYPAQIQYAKKLAKMVGTHIQEEVSEKLFNSKFYI